MARYDHHHPGRRGRRGARGATGATGARRQGIQGRPAGSARPAGPKGEPGGVGSTSPQVGYLQSRSSRSTDSRTGHRDEADDIQVHPLEVDASSTGASGKNNGWEALGLNTGNGQGDNADAGIQAFVACTPGTDATPAQVRHARAGVRSNRPPR